MRHEAIRSFRLIPLFSEPFVLRDRSMLQRVLYGIVALCLMAVLPPAGAWAADSPSDDLVQMIVKLIGDPDKEFRAAGLDK